MEQGLLVFVNGVAGVFAGMGLLYLAVRSVSALVGRFVVGKEGGA